MFFQHSFKTLLNNFNGYITSIHIHFLRFYLFLERGGGMQKEREKTSMLEINVDQVPLVRIPNADQTHHPGMCPDPESNQQPFASRDNAQQRYTSQSQVYMFVIIYLIIILFVATTVFYFFYYK